MMPYVFERSIRGEGVVTQSNRKHKLKRQPLDALPKARLDRAVALLRKIRATKQKVVVVPYLDNEQFWTVIDLQLADVLLPGTQVNSASGFTVCVFPVAAMAHKEPSSGGSL